MSLMNKRPACMLLMFVVMNWDAQHVIAEPAGSAGRACWFMQTAVAEILAVGTPGGLTIRFNDKQPPASKLRNAPLMRGSLCQGVANDDVRKAAVMHSYLNTVAAHNEPKQIVPADADDW